MNNFSDFNKGVEDLYFYKFKTYLSSVGKYLLDKEVNSGKDENKLFIDDGFDKDDMQLYLDKFRFYLESTSRYLMNQKIEEIPYHG